MFKVKSGEEIVAEVRALDPSLAKLKISTVEIEKATGTITYNFICDVAVGEELKSSILNTMLASTSPFFSTVKVTVKKIASDSELINKAIFDFIKKNYPSISVFLKTTDVLSAVVGDVVKYTLRLTKDGVEYVNRNGVIRRLSNYLSHNFCSDFVGSTDVKEVEETVSLLIDDVYESELEKVQRRTIKVTDVTVIDDRYMGDTATYIEDADDGTVTLCGKITKITEKTTKKDKPFFVIHLYDRTGHISGVYFTKKATLENIRRLKEDDEIICIGTIENRENGRSLTISKINRCKLPENFVKQDRYKKSVPKEYKTIFPEPAESVRVASVFDDVTTPLPTELMDKDYVVLDLETTGLDVMTNGITEIGAVKIHKGKITEQWTTLVKPDYPISPGALETSGITEAMVKDKPKITVVLPDFIKFIEDATIVCHNAEFDMKFIRRYAVAEDYDVSHPVLDTLEMSRRLLPQLGRYSLDVVANHFGILFHHHRALSDAYATAESFIELMKLKGKAEK